MLNLVGVKSKTFYSKAGVLFDALQFPML